MATIALLQLLSSPVVLGQGRALPLIDLIEGWAGHVERLCREALVDEASDPWGAHDLVAALHLRDHLERGLRELDLAAPAILRASDELFRSFTKPDRSGALLRLDTGGLHEGWWWERVPRSGQVLRDLDALEGDEGRP